MTRTSVFSDKNVPLPSAKVRSGGGGNGGSWCYSSKFVDGGAPNGGHCTAAQRKRANSSKDLYSLTLHVKAPSVVGIFSFSTVQFGGGHRQSDNTTNSYETSPNMLS